VLTEQEKINKWQEFMQSKEFGRETWIVLTLLGFNLINVIRTIELDNVVIKKVETNEIKHTFNPRTKLRIQQHVMLDSLSKLLVVIETIFALCIGLRRGYQYVPSTLAYYDIDQTRSFIERLRKKNLNVGTILGLPKIENLSLDKNEKKLVGSIFAQMTKVTLQAMIRMAEFYDKYRIIYGKSKTWSII
jgi:hypothetical protein